MIFRLLIYAVIFGAIYFGIRRIMADWRARFRDLDAQTRQRDLKERQRPGVIELEKDEDGVYRPPDDKSKK